MNVSEDLTLLPALRLFTESWWRRQHPWLAEKGYKIIPSQSLSADSDEFSLETVTESDLGSFEIVDRTDELDTVYAMVEKTRTTVLIRVLHPDESEELSILQRVSSPELKDHPYNHCIQLLDHFPVSADSERACRDDTKAADYLRNLVFVVLPLGLDWRQPPFILVRDAIPFIRQMLEGLSFLHSQNISHRNIQPNGICQDPATIPRARASRSTTTTAGVKYLFTDFSLSTTFPSVHERQLVSCHSDAARDFPDKWEPDPDDPSFVDRVPTALYDPFKADIYVMGWVLRRYFYDCMPWLRSGLTAMMDREPNKRPDAGECLARFEWDIRGAQASKLELLKPVPNVLTRDFHPKTRGKREKVRVADWMNYSRFALKALLRGEGYS